MGKLKQYHNSAWETRAQGSGSGGSGTDELAKVSSNDTTAGYLNGKLIAGTGITLTEGSDGGNETLSIAASGTSFDTDFSIKMSADKTLANLTTTKIDTFDTIVIDSNSEWDAVNLWWECVDAGTYVISAQLVWTPDATGYRTIYIYIDGAAVAGTAYLNSGASLNVNTACIFKKALTVGQYVEIYGRHNAGHDLDAIVAAIPAEWQIWRIK